MRFPMSYNTSIVHTYIDKSTHTYKGTCRSRGLESGHLSLQPIKLVLCDNLSVCMYVCMYVRMYLRVTDCMYCMHACMYVCI
jgi:hypothetical protein